MSFLQRCGYSVPCRDLPELQAWRENALWRDALLQETGGGAVFVERATQTLKQTLLSQPPSSDITPSRLSRLLQKGYTHEQVARAFAVAWLLGTDNFYLPRFRWVDSVWVTHGIPILASLVTVTAIALALVVIDPDFIVGIYFLASFLAIPALGLVWLYGRVWRVLLRLLAGLPNQSLTAEQALQLALKSVAVVSQGSSTSVPAHHSPQISNTEPRNYVMYQSIEVFDTIRHALLGWRPVNHYGFASKLTTVRLSANELSAAVCTYPVVFQNTGPVTPTAILGLADRNQFVDDEQRWRGADIPAAIRHYPFLFFALG